MKRKEMKAIVRAINQMSYWDPFQVSGSEYRDMVIDYIANELEEASKDFDAYDFVRRCSATATPKPTA